MVTAWGLAATIQVTIAAHCGSSKKSSKYSNDSTCLRHWRPQHEEHFKCGSCSCGAALGLELGALWTTMETFGAKKTPSCESYGHHHRIVSVDSDSFIAPTTCVHVWALAPPDLLLPSAEGFASFPCPLHVLR
eukprot:4176924-Amphidinium_carterae.1